MHDGSKSRTSISNKMETFADRVRRIDLVRFDSILGNFGEYVSKLQRQSANLEDAHLEVTAVI